MEENKNESEVEETLELPEIEEGQEDTTDYKAEALKLRDKAIAQRERTKALKKERDEAKQQAKQAVELLAGTKKEPSTVKTGELDETQLDYLDLKGISDSDEIDLIQRVMKNTGQTVRQVLKDEYVTVKLEALKKDKEVKAATPTSTKRSSGSDTTDVSALVAKYEQSGYNPDTLPADFTLRSKVINAMTAKTDGNQPAWRR